MAIYHLSAKVLGRSGGRSATAAAAYRSGSRIRDSRTGITFDYSRRKYVAWRAIAAPEHAAPWALDRQRLWDAVEAAEKRFDSQVAREVEIALPVELCFTDRLMLIAEFVGNEFVDRGMVCDLAIHDNPGNPHCHILLTMRELLPDGFGKKVRAWNDRALLESWRESWAAHCNQALARAGERHRIDHRTLAAQGIHRVATRHEGVRSRARMKRALAHSRGITNRRGGAKMETSDRKETLNKTAARAAHPATSDTLRAGVAPVDWKQGHEGRTTIAVPDYQRRLSERLGDRLHGVQYYDDFKSLHVRIKGGSLRDYGDRLVPKFGGTSAEVAAIVELALFKGWDGISVSGGENFRRSLWREAINRGYAPDKIVGYDPKPEDLDFASSSDGGRGSDTSQAITLAPPPTIRRKQKM